MKRFLATLGVAAIVLAGTFGYTTLAGDTAEAKTEVWSGWITDETCGAKNANAEGKACALKCAKAGAKLVLYTQHEKELIHLDNQEEAMKHVGYPVTVTGTYENGTIKVQKIEEKKG